MKGRRAVWLVAEREIRERGRSRAFLGSTVFVLLLVVGVIGLSTWAIGDDDPYQLGLVGSVPLDVRQSLAGSDAAPGSPDVELRDVPSLAAAESEVLDGALDAALVGTGVLVVQDEAPAELRTLVAAAVRRSLLADRLAAAGVEDRAIEELLGGGASLEVRSLEPDAAEDEGGRILVTVVGIVLLLMAIMLYGQWVLMSVVEEKSSRIVEVLLGTLRPDHLLAGKVLGLGLLGLAQLLVLVLTGGLAALVVGIGDMPDTTLPLALAVVFWFVAGFVLFSVAFAVVGATVSRHEDASNASTPVTMVVMATYFLTIFVLLRDPDGVLATVLSIVPPFSPLAMPGRIGVGDPAAWEVALAVALVVPAVYALLRLGGRLYTGAVLRTGPRVRLADAWRSAGDVAAGRTASES